MEKVENRKMKCMCIKKRKITQSNDQSDNAECGILSGKFKNDHLVRGYLIVETFYINFLLHIQRVSRDIDIARSSCARLIANTRRKSPTG